MILNTFHRSLLTLTSWVKGTSPFDIVFFNFYLSRVRCGLSLLWEIPDTLWWLMCTCHGGVHCALCRSRPTMFYNIPGWHTSTRLCTRMHSFGNHRRSIKVLILCDILKPDMRFVKLLVIFWDQVVSYCTAVCQVSRPEGILWAPHDLGLEGHLTCSRVTFSDKRIPNWSLGRGSNNQNGNLRWIFPWRGGRSRVPHKYSEE